MKLKRRGVLILIGILILAIFSGLFLVWQKRATFLVRSGEPIESTGSTPIEETSGEKSPISGLACENFGRRPIGVMLSSDALARPLSGISEADLVFEMPVTEGDITRLMGIFICGNPPQIGSVRSARHDFIPLAAGVDAIYAHWGGSHFALDKLKTGIIDNLNALPNHFNTFYRQSGIAAPHNGFTSMNRILSASQKLGYRTEGKFSGYLHLSSDETKNHGGEEKVLRIQYAGAFRTGYEYDPQTNSYLRYRGGTAEIDKNTGKQVEVKNIVIMRAISRPLEGQYNDVQVEGEGKAEYYLNGGFFKGTWKKDSKSISSKLFFFNEKGEEVKFVPGAIWVEIVDPTTPVTYE